MTEVYEVAVNVLPTAKQQIFKKLFYLFMFATLAFAIPAGLVSLYYLIGMVGTLLTAILFYQIYLSGVVSYSYAINRHRLIISKTKKSGRTVRCFQCELKQIKFIKSIESKSLEKYCKDTICFFDTVNLELNRQITLIELLIEDDIENCKKIALSLNDYGLLFLQECCNHLN